MGLFLAHLGRICSPNRLQLIEQESRILKRFKLCHIMTLERIEKAIFYSRLSRRFVLIRS